ncbi:MAG: aspartate kinase [Oscillospiraceae bacterium]|jgi:aspartate kinase|nr:aspartate kinase [Oscillospiraceae bacterium]
MGLIVQKFGGTSVSDDQRIFNVAKIVTKAYSQGNDVVVVVSAQGSTTDDLIAKARGINMHASKREMDVLLSSGEQISVSLLAIAIESMKFPVVSLLGWQAGFHTCLTYGSAKIEKVDSHRIKKELDKKNIVIVAGFQGINECSDITTMGRGGSDTSAVAIAAAMNADACRIYTDVEGVYTADPKIVKNAKKLNIIDYDEMLELSTLGAQVLNNRSVEMAKKYNVEVEVLSSMEDVPGTVVKEMKNVEKRAISGVAADNNIARITVTNIPDKPGFAFKLFSKLSANNIMVDVILQSHGKNNLNDISFTVTNDCLGDAVNILKKYTGNWENSEILYDENVSKVSIVGTGMETQVGIASKMFEALYEAQINIQMISTSEIKVSVLIDSSDTNLALNSIHDKFFR